MVRSRLAAAPPRGRPVVHRIAAPAQRKGVPVHTDLLPLWMRQPSSRRRPWLVHVNATANFGGVAELLARLVHAQDARGVEVGWAVINGSAEFFNLAKQLHYLLHGKSDPSLLRQPEQAQVYRAVLRPQAAWLAEQVGPGDVVVLHDAQTLGMAADIAATGARVVWHLHIGTEVPEHPAVAEVWAFFADDLRHVDAVLTTRAEFAPPAGPPAERYVVAPAIDSTAAKNRPLTDAEVTDLLDGIGLTGAGTADQGAVVEQDQPLPTGVPIALQVSRWDPLKDMAGVLRCFAQVPGDAHLVLAGPDPDEIMDDPEGRSVRDSIRAARAALPAHDRARVHLVMLSMQDLERNALLVNALQRRADVVLQKSLEEGFGLTLAEAMHKGRAVVASEVGGLRLQVDHDRNGLLVGATDDGQTVAALTRLFGDPELRRRLGRRATESVADRYLMHRLVDDYQKFVHPSIPGA